MIGRLRELRTKQRLPGGKHFQIGCITMLHQQSSASQSRLQGSDLFIQQDSFSLTGLIGNQRIIHLTTGIEQRLLKTERRFFLLRTGNAVLCHHLSSVKERPTADARNLPGLIIIAPAEFVHPALPLKVMEG